MPTLFVRLPNHLGDACMCLPALDLLARSGQALVVVGRPWAPALLEGYDWVVLSLRGGWRERVALLRAARRRHPGDRAILFTNSFSSALEYRLAGLRGSGYATDGRRWLLARALDVPAAWRRRQMHTVEYYLALARLASADIDGDRGAAKSATGQDAPQLALRLAPAARSRAQDLLLGAGVDGRYTVLCPGVVGVHHGRAKAWSEFPRLCSRLLEAGIRVVAVPGPGERATVEAAAPGATILPETDVGAFAALLAAAQLVVANDSGPSHVAAAVGAPLIAVFGVTDPVRTRPWSPRADLVGGASGWPDFESVWQRVCERLQLAAVPAALA